MRKRLTFAALATAAAAVLAGGTAYAVTSAAAPASQPVGNWVYACVKSTGAVDYLEFRGLLPHECKAGDALWRWPAVIPPVRPAPTPAPTR